MTLLFAKLLFVTSAFIGLVEAICAIRFVHRLLTSEPRRTRAAWIGVVSGIFGAPLAGITVMWLVIQVMSGMGLIYGGDTLGEIVPAASALLVAMPLSALLILKIVARFVKEHPHSQITMVKRRG